MRQTSQMQCSAILKVVGDRILDEKVEVAVMGCCKKIKENSGKS